MRCKKLLKITGVTEDNVYVDGGHGGPYWKEEYIKINPDEDDNWSGVWIKKGHY
jgi:hypothetical protein